MKSPVLFLIFKRVETTKRVFERIREVRPSKLYIAADGPRLSCPGEREKCEQTRKIVENIDWPCDVHRLYQDNNLGCGKGVSTAISWFFDNEEEGIIIEDDILPHPDFFKYCDEMLEKYRYEERIQLITGWNPFFKEINRSDSYYMSSNFHIWGWASWRRVWNSYEFDASQLSKVSFLEKLTERMPSKCYTYYSNIFDMMSEHRCDTWDYQLYFNQIIHNRYTIVPYINMVENIGMGSVDAAHTTSGNNEISNHKARSPYPIIHPLYIKEDKNADLIFVNNSRLFKRSPIVDFFHRINRKLKNVIQKCH